MCNAYLKDSCSCTKRQMCPICHSGEKKSGSTGTLPNCSCSAPPQLFAFFIPSTFCDLWVFGRFVGYWREPDRRQVVLEHGSQTPQGYRGRTVASSSTISWRLPYYRGGGRSPSGDRIQTLCVILSSAKRAGQ